MRATRLYQVIYTLFILCNLTIFGKGVDFPYVTRLVNLTYLHYAVRQGAGEVIHITIYMLSYFRSSIHICVSVSIYKHICMYLPELYCLEIDVIYLTCASRLVFFDGLHLRRSGENNFNSRTCENNLRIVRIVQNNINRKCRIISLTLKLVLHIKLPYSI